MQKSNMKTTYKDVDSYINSQPSEIKDALTRLRMIIKETVPDAEETISYGMPAFKYLGALVYFAAFKNHCSFFPGGGNIIEMFRDELKNFVTPKGTIQFTTDRPLPKNLVRKIVQERMRQNEQKLASKTKK